jgi:Ca-activated chloride channel family protein
MEKTKINSKLFTSYADKFFPWLVAGALLLFLETVLANTWLRKLP